MSNFKRPSNRVKEELQKIPTATLSDAVDALGLKGFMTGIRPILEGVKIVGPAVTALFVEYIRREEFEYEYLMRFLRLIEESRAGDVIVIGSDVRNIAVWGGLLSTASKVRRLEGAVMDGATRDLAEIRGISFPVFASSINPSSTTGRLRPISLNEPVMCGGVYVRPGDIIIGDDDGVVVIPEAKVDDVLKIARKMEEDEKLMSEALKKGESITETLKRIGRI